MWKLRLRTAKMAKMPQLANQDGKPGLSHPEARALNHHAPSWSVPELGANSHMLPSTFMTELSFVLTPTCPVPVLVTLACFGFCLPSMARYFRNNFINPHIYSRGIDLLPPSSIPTQQDGNFPSHWYSQEHKAPSPPVPSWRAITPGGARCLYFSPCPYLPVTEAKLWASVGDRCGLSSSAQLPSKLYPEFGAAENIGN